MNDKETIITLMNELKDIRRIQKAENREEEINDLITFLKAKLEACGVNTEQL